MLEEYGYSEHDENRARNSAKEFEDMRLVNPHPLIDLIKVDEIFHYYLQNNDLQRARDLVESALVNYPATSDLYHKLARIELELNHFDRALAQIELALNLSPMLGEYLIFKSELLARTEQYDEAITLLEKLLPRSDIPQEVLLQLGNIAQICNRPWDCERYYRQALEADPGFEDALYELAFFLESEDRQSEAFALYEQFLDRAPYTPGVWYNLAQLYRKQGNFELAQEALDYALCIQEELAPAWFLKGELCMEQNRPQEALQAFLESLTHLPGDTQAMYHVAECYELLENYRDAIRYYQKCTKADPDLIDAWMGLGYCLERREQFIEAIHYYTKAFRLDEENVEVCLSLAICEYKLGNLTHAYLYFERASQLDPHELSIWQDWSEVLYEHDNLYGAIAYLEEGIKHNPKEAELYYLTAAYCYEGGLREKADMYLENALLLNYQAHPLLFQTSPVLRLDAAVGSLIRQYKP